MNKDKSKSLTSKQLKFLILALAFLAYGVSLINQKVTLVLTPSIDYTFFWKVDGSPERGDYATFTLKHDLIGEKPIIVTKRVTCGPGDNLEIYNKIIFYCNGNYLGEARLMDATGEFSLPVSEWQGVIPEGNYFFQGTHISSFDSRYFGLISQEGIQRLVALI